MLSRNESAFGRSFEMEVAYSNKISIISSNFATFIDRDEFRKKVVFIDPVVLAHQESFLDIESQDSSLVLVPTNLHEATKNIESLSSVLDVLESQGVGRKGDLVCAVGGGALLDTVSFAASIFRRGVSVVKVPTTLLGIVDAAVGIKTGINYLGQRNRLGSYHFNYDVLVDPGLMQGLNKGLVRQGLGEIFKIATIKSESLFDTLVENRQHLERVSFYQKKEGKEILYRSIELMLEELHENPREDNLKRCVDFGHSFSPLVEMESIRRLDARSIPHGYAVAYDCILTAIISFKRGRLSRGALKKIIKLFNSFDFDLNNEIYQDHNLLWASFLEMTKHRGGNQNLPIPIKIGQFEFIQDVTFEEVSDGAKFLSELLKE